MEGYLNPLYAQSFSEIGEPLYLPKSKGWLIKRQIPGSYYFDAMGPYPLFFCENWDSLAEDINSLKDQIVAISLVIGPFQSFSKKTYQEYFDIFYEYKNHFILDTTIPLKDVISTGRRTTARRALRNIDIDIMIAPDINLDEWDHLYTQLIRRHAITGMQTFSRKSFEKQIAIQDAHFFRATHQNKIVGGSIFYIQNDVSYYHLSALTDKGYELRAGYALMWVAINYLAKKTRWIAFGGGTGSAESKTNGLAEFKMGWASSTQKSYFCGKIVDREIYTQLIRDKDALETHWFPAYRQGEF